MNLLFAGAVAGNGFNSLGHYVRAEPLVSSCTDYVTRPALGCSANFASGSALGQLRYRAAAPDPPARRRVSDRRRCASPSAAARAQWRAAGLLTYLTASGR